MAIAIGVGVALAVYGLLLWRASRVYGADTTPDERHRITTDDGWELSADRHLPAGSRRAVVIACHGFAATRVTLDPAPGFSLVEHLVSHGFEVWNVDLRGAGHSPHRPGMDVVMEDYIRHDVPAFLEAVCRIADTPKVHWVGHSMGGVLMYGHLAANPGEQRVSSVCGVASPVLFLPARPAAWALAACAAWARRFGRAGMTGVCRALTPLATRLPLNTPAVNLANMSGPVLRRAAWAAFAPVSLGLLEQGREWVRQGRMVSRDGRIDYLQRVAEVRVPTCLIAGAGDQLAPLRAMRPTYEALGAEVKALHEVGRAGGARVDHCHGGLLFGRDAPAEIYPRVTEWLESRC